VYVHRNPAERATSIVGLGTFLPDTVVTSEELERQIAAAGIGVTPGFIERATGIRTRHVARAGENASDLATAAALKALDRAGLRPADVDLLIFAAASHDITEPATAHIVQSKLGARNAIVFDLKNACNSAITALDVADAYVRGKRARVVLIATGEMPSLACDLRFTSREQLTERFAHLTFGDAGGALVLTESARPGSGILAIASIARGEAWKLGTILSYGTMHPGNTYPEGAYFQAESAELERYGRTEVPNVMRAALTAAEWDPADVDVVASHQHTERILHEIAEEVGIRPRALMLPLRYAGNAVSANISLALECAHGDGLLKPDARVLLVSGGSGFSASAVAVRW